MGTSHTVLSWSGLPPIWWLNFKGRKKSKKDKEGREREKERSCCIAFCDLASEITVTSTTFLFIEVTEF